jgi:hypothetical protein
MPFTSNTVCKNVDHKMNEIPGFNIFSFEPATPFNTGKKKAVPTKVRTALPCLLQSISLPLILLLPGNGKF